MINHQQNDLARGLTPPELELLVPLLERREFAAGQTILHWGEPGDCLYVIESGVVCVALPNRGGGESVLAHLGPGQIFGEMAILTGQPRSAEVRALVGTSVQALSVSSFFKVAGRSPTILLNIGRILARRLGHMTRASSHRERRALVALVGPTPPMVGSLLATNLVGALAFVSGGRAVLVDVPAPRASPLPGREWSPGIEAIRGGEEVLAHLSQLRVGPLTLHAVNLPEADSLASLGGPEMVVGALGRLARVAEFIVVNLTGPFTELANQVLPIADRVYVVGSTSPAGGDDIRELVRRCRPRLMPTARLGVIALSGDGSPPNSVREWVQSAVGVSGCLVLPGQAALLREASQVEPPLTIRAPRLALSQILTGLAREVAGLRVGLALGSGGGKGVAHVGVVAALNRLGIPIDVVTGTSIGSLIGAGVAQGLDMQQMEEAMDRLVDLWGDALKLTVPRYSLVSPRGLDRIVEMVGGDLRIEELPLPYGAVATDLGSGRPVYMSVGSLALAVRASISIPVIFPPVLVGDYTLTDGFVSNPVPTQYARLLGADVVLASNLSRPVEESDQSPLTFVEPESGAVSGRGNQPNILDTLHRSFDIMMSGRGEHDCLSADVTLRPRLPQISWNEFLKGGVPVLAGERAVESELASLRELLPWLRVAL